MLPPCIRLSLQSRLRQSITFPVVALRSTSWGGWNRPELEMFGAEMREHDERYEYLGEWLTVIRRLWTENEEFDHHAPSST